ncbi:type II toxin-antitoxin system VapC family toxin [Rhizobium sp. BR 314]|uniref:type II toxin-antitoxin system VapC family toxin n=1 Tax=Rhizobium sp. BR 314 TaxID=3040013 RepID=UPI0039BF5516
MRKSRNGSRKAVADGLRRRCLHCRRLHAALSRFRSLPLRLAGSGNDIEVVRLSRKYRLSAYDTAYLALALLERLPLVTLDRRLADAARAEQVAVHRPIANEH